MLPTNVVAADGRASLLPLLDEHAQTRLLVVDGSRRGPTPPRAVGWVARLPTRPPDSGGMECRLFHTVRKKYVRPHRV